MLWRMSIPPPSGPPADPATPNIYAWPQSAIAGETIAVHGRGPRGDAQIEVARVGVERVVVHTATVPLGPQELPPEADAVGCDWPVVAAFTIDAAWPSGYYEIVLRAGDHPETVAFVVVRAISVDPSRPLLALTTNTWNAYNDFAGTNLYTGGRLASFMRPFAPGYLRKPDGPGSRVAVVDPPDPRMRTHVRYLRSNGLSGWAGSAGWPSWELPFVRWAEANDIGIDYATNADLEDGALLDGRRLYLSVGHDEYWSWPMRDTVEAFIANGGNAAFLSGNVCFWQVRLEDDGQTMVGYKQRFVDDPVHGTDRQERLTSIWSDTLIGRPENSMTGLSFNRGGYHRIGVSVGNGAGGYTVHRPDHWVFAGTDVNRGDLLGAASTVVGYECDGCDMQLVDGVPVPTGVDGCPPGTIVLATAPASPFTRATAQRPVADDDLSEVEFHAWRVLGSSDAETARRLENGHAVFAVRDGSSEGGARRGTVVASGCTDWAWGLTGRDPQIEQITRNIVHRLTT